MIDSRTTLIGLVAAAGLALTGCGHQSPDAASNPGGAPTTGTTAPQGPPASMPTSPPSSPAAGPGAFAPKAVLHGATLFITVSGSSSCPVVVTSATVTAPSRISVGTKTYPTNIMCTTDVTPHTSHVPMPPGVTSGAGELTVYVHDGRQVIGPLRVQQG